MRATDSDAHCGDMNHHYLIDRLVKEHLADLHAEAAQARLIRERGGRSFRLRWRRTRGAPAPLVVIDNPHPIPSESQPYAPRVA